MLIMSADEKLHKLPLSLVRAYVLVGGHRFHNCCRTPYDKHLCYSKSNNFRISKDIFIILAA